MKALIGEGDNNENVKLINEYIIDFYNHYLKEAPFKSAQFQTDSLKVIAIKSMIIKYLTH